MSEKNAHILIIDDEKNYLLVLQTLLEDEGYTVTALSDPETALAFLQESEVDVVVTDMKMPRITGLDVLERVKKQWPYIPVLIMTAFGTIESAVETMKYGAFDYITKPFKLGELCSRIRALLRRAGVSKSEKNTSMECGDITIDLLGSRATLKGKALDLTSAEYRLLCLLVRNANRVVTRDIILNELWDDTGNFVDDNTLSVYVRRLREKVETNPSHPEHLITIRGFGYQWKEVSI